MGSNSLSDPYLAEAREGHLVGVRAPAERGHPHPEDNLCTGKSDCRRCSAQIKLHSVTTEIFQLGHFLRSRLALAEQSNHLVIERGMSSG